jgi:hypothetical protein
MKQNEQLKQPFFAKFLESQNGEGVEASQQYHAAWPPIIPPITSPLKDVEHTLKYPSDGDEV